jgi:hypothetical protein
MRRSEVAALASIAAASPVLTWWLVGDLSEPERAGGLDYLFEPLPLSSTQENLIVGTAAVASVASAAVLILRLHRHQVRYVDVRVLVPLVLIGFYCGISWRTVTAGVHGANIGGGLALLALPLVLLVGALWTVWWRPGKQPTDDPSPGQISRR